MSSLQENVTVSGDKIKGTVKYLSGSNAITDVWGEGYFLALQFTAADWSAYDTAKVGLTPSMGSGLADIKNDVDHNGIFKVTDKNNQKVVVEATKSGKRTRVLYDLRELVQVDAGA